MNLQNPVRRSGVQLRKMEDECLLYDEETGRIHILNMVAGLVWEMCDGSHGIGDMESRLRQECDVPDEGTIAGDLERVIAEFASLGLLDVGADAGPP